MSEEPRRSRRDNKGVNTKHVDEPSPPPPPPKAKVGKKGSRKSNVQEEAVDEEETEAIIRCVCGATTDDGGRMMVCCDQCDAWQHNDCMGVTEIEDELPDVYFCEKCKPSMHKDLVALIKKGEKPWEEIAKRKQNKKSKKGKGRQSAANDEVTPLYKYDDRHQPARAAAPEPVQPPNEKGKRKHTNVEPDEEQQQPSKLRRASGQERQASESSSTSKKVASTATPTSTRGKKGKSASAASSSSPAAATVTAKTKPEPEHERDVEVVAAKKSITDIPNPNRKGVATFMKQKFEVQIDKLSSAGTFHIPDNKTPALFAEQLALAVEESMFEFHCDAAKPDFGGPYKLQMNEISANVSRNSELMLRILNGSVLPYELAKMSSDEMASEKLQQQMASMKEEADKQATLVQEPGRLMMRRTHKGDEYIEDPSAQAGTEFSVSAPVPRRRESEFPAPLSPTAGQDVHMTDDHELSQLAEDRRTSNFDIKSVWNNVQSPVTAHSPQFAAPPPSAQTQEHTIIQKGEHDAEIDRLLEDDDNESAPYSPVDLAEDSSVAWRGIVDMPNVGRFKAFAYHVAGADLSSRMGKSDIFPESLTLSGRIHSEKADEYLGSLGAARNTDVMVHNILPAEGNESGESRSQFEKLFKYFVDRDRWGVVSDAMHREHVTDTYIIPLEAGAGPMPSFLDRLHFNTVESPRPRAMLLAVFVLKWRIVSTATPGFERNEKMNIASGVAMVPPSQTPLGHGQHTSPSPLSAQPSQPLPHHNNNNNHQSYPMPPNPYAMDTASAAQHILGEYYGCSTAQQILDQNTVPEEHLRKLRRIFETNPSTQTDFAEFERVLQGS